MRSLLTTEICHFDLLILTFCDKRPLVYSQGFTHKALDFLTKLLLYLQHHCWTGALYPGLQPSISAVIWSQPSAIVTYRGTQMLASSALHLPWVHFLILQQLLQILPLKSGCLLMGPLYSVDQLLNCPACRSQIVSPNFIIRILQHSWSNS